MPRAKEGRRFLSREVALAILDLKRCRVDDLEPMFPGYTRQEIQNAMSAARRAGLVVVLKTVHDRAINALVGIWGPTPECEKRRETPPPAMPMIASVWQLGSGPIMVPAWQRPVQEYRLLGGWE